MTAGRSEGSCRQTLGSTDRNLMTVLGEEGRYRTMDEDSRRRAVAALINLPGGVLRMSADIPGLVQTSLNMGILKTVDAEALMSFSVRSSVGTEKAEVVSRLENLMEILGGTVECGLFAGKLPGLDCVSFGPDIKDIHTTSEKMEIASVQRIWNYVLEGLKRLK